MADARRAVDEERQKLATYEADLAAARQSIAALDASAKLAATERAAAAEAQKAAEAAATRAGEALASEVEKVRETARDLHAARQERDAAREELSRVSAAQNKALEDERVVRQSTAALEARANLAATERAAAAEAQKAAEAAARRAGEALALEVEKGRKLVRDIDTARRERDAAREELSRVSAAQNKALEDERVVRQSAAALEARAKLAVSERAAAAEAQKAAEAAARRAGEALALEVEKGRKLARDIDTARRERDAAREELSRVSAAQNKALEDGRVVRQSAAALEARAKLAATERAAAVQARNVAETAARRAGEAFALEVEKGRELARDLDTARRERDAAKDELRRIPSERREALDDERDRTKNRDLPAAGRENERRMTAIERVPKVGAGNRASHGAKAIARTAARSVREPESRGIRRVEVRKPRRSMTVALPDELLPKRSPMPGRW
ncbi:hypothetical protein [Sinorhizobium sp. BJ1]|uniref:hypothetical protein n=1 Tax=Sinorhizobium sp. BJ1 TaxID=2035455 RepID=UPI001FDFD70A|nr:hypothetical protein [Sinorhizobium sp. BJ1]